MKQVCGFLFILFFLLSHFHTGLARADFGPLARGVGGGIPVLKGPHRSIRMDSMEVSIRLREKSYRVDAVFHFFNTGQTTTIRIGFPQRGDVPPFTRFDTWVEGKKARVSEEPSSAWRIVYSTLSSLTQLLPRSLMSSRWLLLQRSWRDRWMVQRVIFAGDRQTTIRVSYETAYLHTKDIGPTVIYEYGTGRYWKNKIGKAIITINGTEIGGAGRLRLSPQPASWRKLVTENAVRLEATDWKPGIGSERLTVGVAH